MGDTESLNRTDITKSLIFQPKNIYKYHVYGSPVMCHMSCVMCNMLRVTCHLSLMATATATVTDPPPANSPTMRKGWFAKTKQQKNISKFKKIIQTLGKLNRLLVSQNKQYAL